MGGSSSKQKPKQQRGNSKDSNKPNGQPGVNPQPQSQSPATSPREIDLNPAARSNTAARKEQQLRLQQHQQQRQKEEAERKKKKKQEEEGKSRVTSTDFSLFHMKQARDKVKVQRKKLTFEIAKTQERVKDKVRGKDMKDNEKKVCLMLLARKKYLEKLVVDTDNHLMNIEQQIDSVEMKLVQSDVVKMMEEGNRVMQQIGKELTVARVEEVMEQARECREWGEEIGQLFTDEVECGEVKDCVERELAELEELAAVEQMDGVKPVGVGSLETVLEQAVGEKAADERPVASDCGAEPVVGRLEPALVAA